MTHRMTIAVIQTAYRGVLFRSRLEARWAVFFTSLGLDWQYEPEGFETPVGRYLPDFRVAGCYAEVKPQGLDHSAFDKARALAAGGYATLLLEGSPHARSLTFIHAGTPVALQVSTPSVVCLVPADFKYSPIYHGHLAVGEWDDYDTRVLTAENAALSARFEFGQSGAIR